MLLGKNISPDSTPRTKTTAFGGDSKGASPSFTQQNNQQVVAVNTGSDIAAIDSKIATVGGAVAKTSSQIQEAENPALTSLPQIFTPEEALEHLQIRPSDKIVEFGSGAGTFVLEIAKKLSDKGEVYGVDVQKDLLVKMLREAKNNGLDNVYAVWADLDKRDSVKLADANFDTVLIVNTLFQLEHKKNILFEAHRLLKPLKRLVVIDWDDTELPIGPQKDMLVDKSWLIDELVGMGFVFNGEESLGAHHFMLKFNKTA